jgi:hypothetical protein
MWVGRFELELFEISLFSQLRHRPIHGAILLFGEREMDCPDGNDEIK